MKIYTAAEMREHEQMAVDKGTTFEQLMENAGRAAAADLLRRRTQAGRVLIVCGKGNNGGDGLVMARILQAHGWRADILFAAGEKLSELAELNRSRLQGLDGIGLIAAEDLADRLKTGYDVIIEGIFGTGFGGRLPRRHRRNLPPAESIERPESRAGHLDRTELRHGRSGCGYLPCRFNLHLRRLQTGAPGRKR